MNLKATHVLNNYLNVVKAATIPGGHQEMVKRFNRGRAYPGIKSAKYVAHSPVEDGQVCNI